MQIQISAIGRIKPGPEQELYQQYIRRLPWQINVTELTVRKSLTGPALKHEEGRLLLDSCANMDIRIALDEHGKDLTSPELAELLRKIRDNGARQIAFLIGGADGLDEPVRKASQHVLSLSKLTWPHMLVRALLAEQLYRAWSILENHPYHRE